MKVNDCKILVERYFKSRTGYERVKGELTWKGKRYRIIPDGIYLKKSTVLVTEYEYTKRPVESISKYWWLYRKTDWKRNNVKTILLVIGLRQGVSQIREEAIEILGEQLAMDNPKAFHFHYLRAKDISKRTVIKVLEKIGSKIRR